MKDDIERKCGYCNFKHKDAKVVIDHIIKDHPEIVEAERKKRAELLGDTNVPNMS